MEAFLKLNQEPEISAEAWATAYAAHMDNKESSIPLEKCREIEQSRAALLNHFRNFKEGNPEFDQETGYQALLTCMTLDRQNALRVMKLSRDDPECPRGIPWAGEDDIAKEVQWKDNLPRCSQTRHYLRFAAEFKFTPEQDLVIKELLAPKYPKWMVEKWQLSYPSLD